jgi:hypothetical protein
MVTRASPWATQPERTADVGTHGTPLRSLASSGPDLSPVSFRTTQVTWRSYPRQEPSALVAPAGICAGDAGKPASLPRSTALARPGEKVGLLLLQTYDNPKSDRAAKLLGHIKP